MSNRTITIIKDYIDLNVELKSRKRKHVCVRYYLMTYLKRKTKLSLAGIGAMFGGKDHATVLYGVREYDIIKNYEDVLSYTAEVKDLFPIDAYTLGEDAGIDSLVIPQTLQSLQEFYNKLNK
jgi:hypothetical protein